MGRGLLQQADTIAEKEPFGSFSAVAYSPTQSHSLHLQQRHSTHLHSTHLQQAQLFFSISTAFMTFSWTTAGCRRAKAEA
jgi:hypothetical protein